MQNKIHEVDIFTKFRIVFLSSSEGAKPIMTLYEVQGSCWNLPPFEPWKGETWTCHSFRKKDFLIFKINPKKRRFIASCYLSFGRANLRFQSFKNLLLFGWSSLLSKAESAYWRNTNLFPPWIPPGGRMPAFCQESVLNWIIWHSTFNQVSRQNHEKSSRNTGS